MDLGVGARIASGRRTRGRTVPLRWICGVGGGSGVGAGVGGRRGEEVRGRGMGLVVVVGEIEAGTGSLEFGGRVGSLLLHVAPLL